MKLKVGDYVRTENGIIAKYHPQCVELNKFENRYYYVYEDEIEYYDHKDLVIKSSPNIIDLIEVGDYVNGDRVLDIAHAPQKALYTNKDFSALLPIENRQIYSIITKEQFEQMEYKVEK